MSFAIECKAQLLAAQEAHLAKEWAEQEEHLWWEEEEFACKMAELELKEEEEEEQKVWEAKEQRLQEEEEQRVQKEEEKELNNKWKGEEVVGRGKGRREFEEWRDMEGWGWGLLAVSGMGGTVPMTWVSDFFCLSVQNPY